jgi:serine/threonine-protein kinase
VAGGADTDIGVMVGTVGYMSPEQLMGERPGVSWDLWALAVVAHECVAGALPFPVASRESWRQLVLNGRRAPLCDHLADAPPEWDDFFARALATNRTRRPRSAAEFLEQLEQALCLGAALFGGGAHGVR